jgi:hypothetical protein
MREMRSGGEWGEIGRDSEQKKEKGDGGVEEEV